MSTTFTLCPGYAWGRSNKADAEDILEIAKSVTIADLKAKCIEYGLSEESNDGDGSMLEDYLDRYQNIPSSDDLTVQFYKRDDKDQGLFSFASGIGQSREMKEIIRRAFFILVLDKCYQRGLAVSLIIS